MKKIFIYLYSARIKQTNGTRIHFITVFLLFFVATLYTLQKFVIVNREPYFINWTMTQTISCHYVTEGDYLPSAESMSPPEDSIFFHETSCRGGLSSREACAVESVARIHPERSVFVFFNSPVSEVVLARSCLAKLKQFKNVHLARLHTAKYAKGTALSDMLARKKNNQSLWRVEHTSDMLRYISMYKYGGVYLDTDVLVVKRLDSLGKDWAAKEDNYIVNVAVLAISKAGLGHQLVSNILDNLQAKRLTTAYLYGDNGVEDVNRVKQRFQYWDKSTFVCIFVRRDLKFNYQPHEWQYNGPGAMTRALLTLCNTTQVYDLNAAICHGFNVYNPLLIYPVHWSNAEAYFKRGNLTAGPDVFTHHLWNRMTQNTLLEAGSPYDRLARQHCPTIREMYGNNFGL